MLPTPLAIAIKFTLRPEVKAKVPGTVTVTVPAAIYFHFRAFMALSSPL